MSRSDFSEPRRMSAGAFFVIFAKTCRQLAGVILIYLTVWILNSGTDFTDASFWIRLLIGIASFLGIALLLTCAAYFPKKFYVSDGKLIFSRGLLGRETVTIPLDRIHTMRTHRGLVYRLFDLRGVSFDTLASKMEEIELILDEADWQSLMTRIEIEESPHQPVDAETPPPYSPTTTLRFDNRSLLLDALCQNHLKGAAVLGGFFAVIYNTINDFSDNPAETISNYAADYYEQTAFTPLLIVEMIAAVYVAVLALWIGKVLLRYYDMKLTAGAGQLTFSSGLLAKSSSRFAHDKLCTIWVKQNIFERWLGLGTLMLKQALFASARKEEDNLKLYGRDRSEFFLKWWLGDDYAAAGDVATAKSGKGAMIHVAVPPAVLSIIASLILMHYQLYGWLIVPAAFFLIYIGKGIMAMRKSRITLKDDYIIVDSGSFAVIRNYLKYDNIEVVRITRTPFTPYFHRVALAISTSGTTFIIRSLKEDEAKNIFELLLSRNEQSSTYVG